MSDVAIKVENLGKKYVLRHQQQGRQYKALRDVIAGRFKSAFHFGRAHSVADRTREEFWALEDVSFEIKQGEAVGIIGRNGAGKSTLLKLLSRISEPTTGRIEMDGRVASLLEVGTGFHPELTGRENIHLNGAILGMTRGEIRRRFDEIIAFAEVEKFLDTPVKRYSSGMYMRLAFAVAAHLDPEILIVDEVLAVGDAEFQRKCLGKMSQVASSGGRTVLFVSHNMAAVTSLCSKTILLKGGKVEKAGPSSEVTDYYLTSAASLGMSGSANLAQARRGGGDGKVRFTKIELTDSAGRITAHFGFGEPIHVKLWFTSEIDSETGVFGFSLRTMTDVILLTSASDDHQAPFQITPGTYTLTTSINPNQLRPGNYWLQVGNTCGTLRDVIPDAIQFEIDLSRHYSTTCIHGLPGFFHFPFEWSQPSSCSQPSQK